MSSKSESKYQTESQLIGLIGLIYAVYIGILLIAAYIVFRVVFFITLTYITYYKVKWLWIVLACASVGAAVGIALARMTGAWPFFLCIPVGIAAILIACLSVHLHCSDTLLRENVNLFSDAVNTSWWSADGQPKKGVAHEPAAA